MRFFLLFIVLFSFGRPLSAQTVFQKKFGAPNCYEEAYNTLRLDNGDFLVSAMYNCVGGPDDWHSWLIKLNPQGDTIWTNRDLLANGFLRRAQDGGLIFIGAEQAGLNKDTIVIYKTDTAGNLDWHTKIFQAQCNTSAYDLINTADGGYALAGFHSVGDCNNLSFDALVAKLTANGGVSWVKTYGGAADDEFYSIRELSSGGYALAGWTKSQGQGNADYWLMRIAANGDSLWAKTYGNTANNFCYGMDQTADGGYILAGYSDSIEVIKTDANGNVQWSKILGEACGGAYFKAYETQDKHYVFLAYERISGSCSSTLFKTNKSGDVLWKKNWGGLLRDVSEPQVGRFTAGGYIDILPDAYAIVFDTAYDTSAYNIIHVLPSPSIKLYPNPANDWVKLELSGDKGKEYQLSVYDVLGKKIIQKTVSTSSLLNSSRWPNGIYLLNLQAADGQHSSQKVLVQHP